MKALKTYRSKAQGLSDLLNYAAVIDDGVILLKSGALMASWMYTGPDTATLTFEELNGRSARINNALQRLGTGWMTQHDVFRITSKKYPAESACHFPDPITSAIDDERRQLYTAGVHHENRMVVTLTYLPPTVGKSKTTALMIDNDDEYNLVGIGGKNIAYFNQACLEFEGVMSSVCNMTRLHGHPEILDIHGNEAIRDDQLRFIHHCITGDNHPINLPPIPMFLDSIIGGQEYYTGLRPIIGDKHIGVICIDGFPQTSFPGILEGLDQHQFEYRWNNRFIYEDPIEAIKQLHKYRRKWQQKKRGFIAQLTHNYNAPVDQYAAQMEAQTENSIAEASSGAVLYGYYTSTIVIMDKDKEVLQAGLDVIRNFINNLGFNARVESINTVEAYLGSLPGHATENLRRPMIHTLNLADLLPISSIWPGHEFCPNSYYPSNSPPLLVTSTTGNTPFRLHLHVGDLGHTFIFGPTGAGKSTLLAILAAQFRKYREATVFIFEKGYSLYPLVSAIPDGSHFDIGQDTAVEFCPLANLETDAQQIWAEEWIIGCLKLQNVTITPEKRNAIKTALHQHQQGGDKSFHDFVVNLQDREMSMALERYTVNDSQNSAILDAEEDTLQTSKFNVFELEHLMEMGDDMVLPVLTYLFQKIEKSLYGQPAIIILDEAWIALGHEVFRSKIREWLKVLRKSNCAVVMATQSISDAANSGILDVINESCPTKIFLPNATAKDESSAKLYAQLGLNSREIDILAKATPKWDYYFRNPVGRRMFNLQLGPLALALAGATGKEDLTRIKKLQKEHGQKWVAHWFNERSVSHEL